MHLVNSKENVQKSKKSNGFFNILSRIICEIYYYVVGILFAVITLWLFLVNIFSTSYMSADAGEHTYYSADKLWLNLLILFTVCVIILIVYRTKIYANLKNKLSDDIFFRRCCNALLLALFLESIILIISLQCIPRADQKSVMDAVHNFRMKDYTDFKQAGYIARYPNQIGLLTIIYAVSCIFGDKNYLVFQVLNALGLVMIYKSLADIAEHFGAGRMSRLIIYIYGILYLPLMLYVPFVYGNIGGLAFSLIAICLELRFLKEGVINRPRTYMDMILSAVCIAIAIMLKSNYLIFLIGMLVYALLKMIKDKKIITIGLIISFIVFYFVQSIVPKMYVEKKIDMEIENGTSTWSWIAMGLQDNDGRANGWYNGYNYSSYTNNDYDSEKQGEVAKAIIESRFDYFKENRDEAVNFFVEKNASQWNNPSFQGFWIVQTMSSTDEHPLWIRRMLSIDGSYIWYRIFDFAQMLTLFGVVLYLVVCRNKADFGYLFLEMIVIGGFIFHTIWEAKCQYIISYYIIFLPIAIRGYSAYISKYSIIVPVLSRQTIFSPEYNIEEYKEKQSKALRSYVIFILGVGVTVLLFSLNSTLRAYVKTDSDTEEYAAYVKRHQYDDIKDGVYRIHPKQNSKYTIASYNTGNTEKDNIYMTDTESTDCDVELITFYDRVCMKFLSNSLYLDLYSNNEDYDAYVGVYRGNYSSAQQWGFMETGEEGIYYIRVGKKSALTYDDESKTVTVKEFGYEDEQKWKLEVIK